MPEIFICFQDQTMEQLLLPILRNQFPSVPTLSLGCVHIAEPEFRKLTTPPIIIIDHLSQEWLAQRRERGLDAILVFVSAHGIPLSQADLCEEWSLQHLIAVENEEVLHFEMLLVTLKKLLWGPLLGIEPYIKVSGTHKHWCLNASSQRDEVLSEIAEWSRTLNINSEFRRSIELISDELMTNSFFHSPVDLQGQHCYSHWNRQKSIVMETGKFVSVHCWSEPEQMIISVRDEYGSMSLSKIYSAVRKFAKTHMEIEDTSGGAGLGLVLILRKVTSLVLNLDPGNSTEFIVHIHTKNRRWNKSQCSINCFIKNKQL
ncbi:hypothetical protein WDW89_04065 [Deltaproteobacteria bacterium TL4]